MKEAPEWKKIVTWTVSILGLLVIAGIFAWHFLKKNIQSNDPKIKSVVTKEIKKVVTEASDSLYKVAYSNFSMNIDSGYADISNLKMTADSAIYKKLVSQNKVPNDIFTLTAYKIIMRNVGFDKVQNENTMHIGSMVINNPSIHIKNKLRSYNDTAHSRSLIASAIKSLFKAIDTDNIVEMKIDNIFMTNTDLIYVNDNGQVSRSTALRNLDITINNVSSGALANKDSTAKKDAVLKIGHQRIVTADKLYNIDFDNMRIIPSDKKIYVGSFTLTPRLTRSEFRRAAASGKANYRYHFKYSGISMNNIDFDRINRRQQFYIGNVTIDDSWSEFYTDYNWPFRTPPDRRNKFPNELLQKLAFDVTIPQMIMKHSDMFFRIVAKKSEKEAVFNLNNIHSVTTNITNNEVAKNANPYAKVVSECKVMNAGLMKSEMTFNLKNKNAPVTLSSTLGSMDGTAFNPLSEALSMMQITSANIEKMKTNMKVDEYRASGNIDFYYKNMKVKLLKKDDDGTLKKRTIFSFFTNMMLPNDNPKKNGKFRKGPINVVRDARESFFGFIWRGMLDGMASAMSGMDQHKKEPGNKVIELAKIVAGPKQGQEEKSAGGDKKRLEKLNAGKKKKKE